MRNSAELVAGRTSLELASSWPFGGYLWARAAAYLGFWAYVLVSALVMFDRTGSLAMVGLITVVQFVPQFVITPVSGILADRGHVATQIVLGFVLVATGSGLLGVWILAVGAVDSLPGAWPVLLSSLVVGFGFAVGSASTAAVLPALVEPDELGAAVALNSVPLMLARAIGPALGGVLAATVGAAPACLAAAGLNLGCGLLLAFMRLPQRLGEEQDANTTMRRAVRYVARDRRLLMVMVGAAAVGYGAEPAVTLAPAIAERFGDVSRAGWVASAFGAGGVLGLPLLGRVRRRLSHSSGAALGLGFMGAGLVVVAAGSLPVVALAGMTVAGVGMTVAYANLATLVQELSPTQLRGRITALWFLCWLGTRPLGALVNGLLGDVAGAGWTLLAGAAVVFAVAFACWSTWRIPTPGINLMINIDTRADALDTRHHD